MILQAGDILFVRGDTPIISPLIKWFLHSEFSHVAIAVDHRTICDIDMFQKMSFRDNPYKDFDVYRPMRPLTYAQREHLIRWLMKKQATCDGYDWGRIRQIILARLFDFKGEIKDKHRAICLEIIDEAYQAMGMDLVLGRQKGNVLFADLLASPLLYKAA